jgi:hypothetical protein
MLAAEGTRMRTHPAAVLLLFLLSLTAAPVQAQRGLAGLRMPSFLGGLRISTGVLTAPTDHYRRTSLPVVLGLGWERTDRAGRRWRLEFGYSGWSEAATYRDHIASWEEPDQTDIRYLESVGVRTFDLSVGFLQPIGRIEAPDLLVGGALGWRRHEEELRYGSTYPSWFPWYGSPERDQVILDLLVVVPLSTSGISRELTFGYRTTLASFMVRGGSPLTSGDGLRAVFSVPFGSTGRSGRGMPRRGVYQEVAASATYQLGVSYGLPGIGPETEALDWGSQLGLDLLVPLRRSWSLLAEVLTYSWRTDLGTLEDLEVPPFGVPPGVPHAPSYDSDFIYFLPQGRDWEVKAGVLSPPLRWFGLRAGALLGIRRHQEWWDFFDPRQYGDVGPQPLPPPDPGAEVQGVGEVRLVFPLGSRPQYPQVHLSRSWGLGRVWPDRRRTAVDPDGWRIALMLPLGRF